MVAIAGCVFQPQPEPPGDSAAGGSGASSVLTVMLALLVLLGCVAEWDGAVADVSLDP